MLLATATPARRGQALIVTLSSLALLALVGITAVYFARDQAEVARIRAQAGAGAEKWPDDGLVALNSFLSTLTYDAPDTGDGLLNATRGHSLMATMYGRVRPGQPNGYPVLPWTGVGTFDGPAPAAFNPLTRRQIVNHRLFAGMTTVIDPEYAGDRAPTATPYVGTHYPKNAAYTYPDVKDFYLAVLCPATGEVLVPSFTRQHLFGSLDPNNANWRNAQGKFLTLRPRPAEHPNFPPVPANPDSPTTWTGDVQNLPGGFFRGTTAGFEAVQKNDSIWIDIGLPPILLANGRKVKPLVAPLILDLDGRLNLSVHGNVLGAGTPRVHRSGEGLGPWEVNLEQAAGTNAVFAAELQAIIGLRNTPRTRSGRTLKAYYERYTPVTTELPQYAQVPWLGFTDPNALVLPGPPDRWYRDAPSYSGGYSSLNTAHAGHPSLFNPHEWAAMASTPTPMPTTDPRVFPISDTKILGSRHAPPRAATDQLSFATAVPPPTFLRGTLTAGIPPAANPYRADPAHSNRHIITTYSSNFAHGVLMPGAQGQAFAGLAPIDLNRQLADYRDNTGAPLSETNIGNAATATTERQQFARDIFARLIAATETTPGATGATVTATGVVTISNTATADQLVALRKLAQLAVNIVDYIDNDDVITPFPWNPAGGTLDESTVFGVEKPRLVLTEAYSEVTNDPTDPALVDGTNMMTAMKDAHVRFWLELQNPTATPYSAGVATHPLGDGSVHLRYTTHNPYRVEIVRETKGGAGASVTNHLVPQVRNNPATPAAEANVTGTFGVVPDLVFDFSTAMAAQSSIAPSNGNPDLAGSIAVCVPEQLAFPAGANSPDFRQAFPNSIQAGAMPMAIGGNTTALSYPLPLMGVLNGGAIAPELTHHVVALRRLANPYLPFHETNNPYVTVDVLNHVRTADRVKMAHGTTMQNARQPRMGENAGYDPTAGGNPDLRPQSYGKVQPYTAWSASQVPQPATFPNSLVLAQNPDAVNTNDGVRHTLGRGNYRAATPPNAATFTPPNTLALNETIMTPYDWLVHLDRPLINQMELLHVSLGKPHELTTDFIRPAVNGVALSRQSATVYFQVTQPGDPLQLYSRLYRALDLLRVQPRTHQSALGGRVSGLININTIQDRRVWNALFDAQSASGVNINSFNQAFVDDLWDRLMATRTSTMVDKTDAIGTVHRCPVPGASVHDGATGTANPDRPFLPFGAATVPSGGDTFLGGTGLNDTLLRIDTSATPRPYLTVPDPATPGVSLDPPYRAMEAARKILNNTTTVSNSFAVWVTVGYFDIEPGSDVAPPAGSNWPAGVRWDGRYGREYYREVPGDTRHRFFSIVDRTHVGLDPARYLAYQAAPTTNPPPDLHATVTPFHTTLEANALASSTTLRFSAALQGTNVVVYTNGTAVPVGNTLVVGVGATREIVTVAPGSLAYDAATGTATVNVQTSTISTGQQAASLQFSHYAGENVSNVVPGNPGPQSGFDVNLDKYKAVVPYWTRIQ